MRIAKEIAEAIVEFAAERDGDVCACEFEHIIAEKLELVKYVLDKSVTIEVSGSIKKEDFDECATKFGKVLDMFEDEDNKHIKVELDFVPVDERMPDEEVLVFAMIGDSFGKLKLRWDGLWCNEDSAFSTVTHWAEIPTINKATRKESDEKDPMIRPD